MKNNHFLFSGTKTIAHVCAGTQSIDLQKYVCSNDYANVYTNVLVCIECA